MLHTTKLKIFMGVMILHWIEHVAQIYQLYVLHLPRCCAMGFIGQFFPVLMTTEWLHFGFAVLTLAGCVWLLPGFLGAARNYWLVAYGISVWHLLEHTLLFVQAQTGHFLLGYPMPVSILQLAWPSYRAEIHLFYNTIVTIPMLAAMILDLRFRVRMNRNIYHFTTTFCPTCNCRTVAFNGRCPECSTVLTGARD